MRKSNRKNLKPILFILCLALLWMGLFLIFGKKKNFEINKGGRIDNQVIRAQESPAPDPEKISPVSGLVCDNAQRRPFAVMLSADAPTRPLSGVGQADLVIEMPVTPLDDGGITRMMAIYICEDPPEIGSVRSARHPFIPLVIGFDAIYAHWGGSHFALDILRTGAINDLDALVNPFNTYWRKSTIEAPHNGFTSMARLVNAARKSSFRLETKFSGYSHLSAEEVSSHSQEKKTLTIGYSGEFEVVFQYSPESNSYLRWRGNKKEVDKNTSKQVEAKNVVVMRSEITPLEGQYNNVLVEGRGKAEYYINGQKQEGAWEKDKNDKKSKLSFFDEKGQEIKFTPGSIWVEIADPSQNVSWN